MATAGIIFVLYNDVAAAEGAPAQIVGTDTDILWIGLIGKVVDGAGDALCVALSISADTGNGLLVGVDQTAGGMTTGVDDEGQLGPVVGLTGPGFQRLAAGGSKVGGTFDLESLLDGQVFVTHVDLGSLVGLARGELERSVAPIAGLSWCGRHAAGDCEAALMILLLRLAWRHAAVSFAISLAISLSLLCKVSVFEEGKSKQGKRCLNGVKTSQVILVVL